MIYESPTSPQVGSAPMTTLFPFASIALAREQTCSAFAPAAASRRHARPHRPYPRLPHLHRLRSRLRHFCRLHCRRHLCRPRDLAIASTVATSTVATSADAAT